MFWKVCRCQGRSNLQFYFWYSQMLTQTLRRFLTGMPSFDHVLETMFSGLQVWGSVSIAGMSLTFLYRHRPWDMVLVLYGFPTKVSLFNHKAVLGYHKTVLNSKKSFVLVYWISVHATLICDQWVMWQCASQQLPHLFPCRSIKRIQIKRLPCA